MLVTSRDTGRWIIPKGWPIAREAPHASAEREALEEAGIVGTVARDSIGTYLYEKRLAGGAVVICEVLVFPLEVTCQQDDWPEKEERAFQWFSPDDAAKAVQEPALREIILNIRSFQVCRQSTSCTSKDTKPFQFTKRAASS
jgi:8-oxo-dGTP pyrophosphatase MutT (NUDIX family)